VDPKGEFRMIGDVLGVEANGLRETMAVRPPPSRSMATSRAA